MLDPEFLKTCESSSVEEIRKMPSIITETFNFLKFSLPNKITLTITDIKYFEGLMNKDYRKGEIIYWKEIDERIKFLWQSIALKGFSLLKNIVDCINSKNYFPALISTRALLENIAVFHYYIWKIVPTYNEFMKNKNRILMIKGEYEGIIISSELEELLILYTHGTRLKELTEVRKKWKQKSISEYIKFLSENKSYTKASHYYSILCEIAHPNSGSNMIFYNICDRDNEKEMHYFSNQQNLNFFLEVSAYPLNISCQILKEGIKVLQQIRFVDLVLDLNSSSSF
jgi:hypothetical protein